MRTSDRNAGFELQQEPTPAAKPVQYFGYLDSLRGVAILGVLGVHSVALTLQHARWSNLLYATGIGVQLFYMVSAFTLFLSLDGRSKEKHPIGNFFIRRFFRIAPLFYIVILLTWVRLQFPSVHGYRPTLPEYLSGFTFLFGFSWRAFNTIVVGGWSIAVETTFYALLPLLHRWLRSTKTSLLWYAVSLSVVSPVSYLLIKRFSDKWVYFGLGWFPIQFPVFLLGIVLYFVWKERLSGKPIRTTKTISGLCLLAAVVLFLRHVVTSDFRFRDLPIDTAVIALGFIATVLYPWPIVVNPITRYLGKVSYSVYLLHPFVFEAMLLINAHLFHNTNTFLGAGFGRWPSFVLMFVILTLITAVVATFSWKWIEQPGVLLGRRWIASREPQKKQPNLSTLPSLSSQSDTSDAQF